MWSLPARQRRASVTSVIPGAGSRGSRQRRVTGRQPADPGEPPRPDHQRGVGLELGQVRVVTDPHRLRRPCSWFSRARTWSRRACRSRPRVVEYRRDFDAKWPRKPSMSAHRPQPLYGPSGPVRPANPARSATFPTSFFSRAQMRVRSCRRSARSAAALVAYFATYAATVSGCSSTPVAASRSACPCTGRASTWRAEPQQPHHIAAVDRRRLVRHLHRRPAAPARPASASSIDGRRRERIVPVRVAVEPDQGVEVDDAASLELGHLRELHPHQLPTRRLRQAEVAGEGAARGRW